MSLDHGGGLTRPHRRGCVHLESSPANSEDESDASRDGENSDVEFANLHDIEPQFDFEEDAAMPELPVCDPDQLDLHNISIPSGTTKKTKTAL